MRISDWSSDVCSSDLLINGQPVKADLIGPYVGNPQGSLDQIMLNMGATVWTEHLGQVNHMVARMPAYTTANSIPNDRVPSKVPPGCYLVMGDNRRQSRQSLVGLHAGAEPGRQGLPDLDELERLGYRRRGFLADRHGDPLSWLVAASPVRQSVT